MSNFFVIFIFVMLFCTFININVMRLSSFSSSYSALHRDVTRYYTLYNVAKMDQDENRMSEAFAKLESCFASYQEKCEKRDGLLSLTNLVRASYPNLFAKIDRETEEMEAIFTVCRLKA